MGSGSACITYPVLGGHVQGQVFFFEPHAGVLFCSDYLIDIHSLSERDKNNLSVAKYLLISTNSHSEVFHEEMRALQNLMRATQRHLESDRRLALVCPGHGDFYRVR